MLLLSMWIVVGSSVAQPYPYGNEWIDYNKTYYKFKVFPNSGSTSAQNNNNDNKANFSVVHRIQQNTLVANGLGNVQAQDFQLWRNGEEVALYTSVASGSLGGSDFIEFWGEINDAKPDRALFRSAGDQFNARWNLFTDTACYYLTVNAGAANKRFAAVPNTAATTTLPVEPFFMHTIKINYKATRFGGFGVDIGGKIVRSANFDAGEGWSDRFYGNENGNRQTLLTGLKIFRNGPPLTFRYSAAGQAGYNRDISVSFRNRTTPVVNDTVVNTFRLRRLTPGSSPLISLPTSVVPVEGTDDNLRIIYRSPNNPGQDRDELRVLEAELVYPRHFDFNTTSDFEFSMPPTATGQFIKIRGFLNATVNNAVLYDLTNLQRIETVRNNNEFWFVLPPSAMARKVIFSPVYPAPNIVPRLVQSLEPKTFTNYAQNPGNYLILSNSRLLTPGNNHVQAYADYRSSAGGGGYAAKVYDVEDFYDQFSFGIRKHPLAIRNFIRYANDSFATKPKYVFIVGRGVTYNSYGINASNSIGSNEQNLVPTWGWPASDNMLAADPSNKNTTPLVPIGRLAAALPTEVRDYLEKVKEFETLQNTPAGKPWQKEVLHLIGGSDANIVGTMTQYMDTYKQTIADSFVAANVQTFTRINDPNTSENNAKIQQTVTNGTGLVSYFGHSSSTSLDFNLNDPYEVNNTNGKYPFYLLNGCNASEFFVVNQNRAVGGDLTLSEKFVMAKQRGAIGFASSSHYGVLQYLNLFSDFWYKAAAQRRYGLGIGNIMQDAIAQNMAYVGLNEFYGRLTAEEYILHADPAVRIFSEDKPDFVIDSTSIKFVPVTATTATDSVLVTVRIVNNSKSTATPVWLHITRRVENHEAKLIYKSALQLPNNETLLSVKVPILGNADKGWNYFTATVDVMNAVEEYREDNNSFTDSLIISNNDIKPILPYPFAIVNALPIKFVGSTANPFAELVSYRFQLDTTNLFNSPQLVQQDVVTSGANVELLPSLSLQDSTVYYWRMASITNGLPGTWHQSSFIYLPSSTEGFNQSHFYQHQQSEFTNLKLNASNRSFYFDSTKNNLYLVNGIFWTSAADDAHSSITQNGEMKIYSGCIGQSLRFNVFDSLSFKPWTNSGTTGRFGSVVNCAPGRENNFEFKYWPASERKKVMDFLDSIPKGMIVTMRMDLNPDDRQPQFPTGKADSAHAAYWMRDTLLFGANQSLYHYLVKQGFRNLAEMKDTQKTLSFIFKKDDTVSFKPNYKISTGLYDRLLLSADFNMVDTGAVLTSPVFGPASEWKELHWKGHLLTPNGDFSPNDSLSVGVIGVDNSGAETPLKRFNRYQQDADISDIDATTYPYIRLKLINNSPNSGIPYQLDYWRLNFEPIPEGAVAPELYYDFTRDANTNAIKDTLKAFTDSVFFGIAFKNISNKAFNDSLVVDIRLYDSAGVETVLPAQSLKQLAIGDSVQLFVKFATDTLQGAYNLRVNFNPNKLQKEQTLENNAITKQFFVTGLPEGRAAPDLYLNFTQNANVNAVQDTLMGYKDSLLYGVAFKNTSSQPFNKPMAVELSLLDESAGTESLLQQTSLRQLPAQDSLHFNFAGGTDTLSGWYTLRTEFNPNQNEREQTLTNNSHMRRFFVDQRAEAIADSASFFQFTISPTTGRYADTLLASADKLEFGLAIKNIGRQGFNSTIPITVQILSDAGLIIDVPFLNLEALAIGDTSMIYLERETATMSGWYTIRVHTNPSASVPEQDYANNIYTRRFFVYNIVLPVNITQFTATTHPQGVLLNWTSQNEINFLHYEVQHSADGQQFTTVSKLQALQRQSATTYQFLHTQPIQGNNFYRLKITNNDGSVQYSAIRQVRFGAAFNVKVMPNPFHNTLNISIIGESRPTQIKLLDTKGQLLLQTIAMQNISLNTANLPSGIYMVLATNSRGHQVQLKVTKQ